MNASKALELTKNSKEEGRNQDINDILKQIEYAANNGENQCVFVLGLLDENFFIKEFEKRDFKIEFEGNQVFIRW